MTIECTDCHARYTIADALVPPQGARVRCRKCGSTIAVKPLQPVVTPEELPLVPPSPEPAAASPEPAPRSPEPAPAHAASALFPSVSEPPSPPSAPSPVAEQGFERFPTHNISAQGSPGAGHSDTGFERFPSARPEAAPPAPEPDPAPEPEMEYTAPLRPPPSPSGPAPSQRPAPAPASNPEPAAPQAPAAAAVPQGLSPEESQRHERARRLARVLASDIAIYNREKRERGIRDGNLVAVLGYEIKKSWETYKERVGADFANSTPYFRDALNEIVAEGQKIF